MFGSVTVSLLDPDRWGGDIDVRYHQPGQAEAAAIAPEVHADMVRITLPRLATWGIVEIRPAQG